MAEYNIPEAWSKSFLERNPGDVHRLQSAYASDVPRPEVPRPEGAGGGEGRPDWLEGSFRSGLDRQTQLMEEMWGETKRRNQEQAAREAERKGRADQLYGTLMGRAGQALSITPDDPIIRGQVDAFRGEQERSRRNYISDLAESAGPLANLRGEQRIAAERTGQSVGSFQAELLARDLTARRAEIADALASMGGMLGADQEAGLRSQIASIDNQLGQLQSGAGMVGTVGGLANDRLRSTLQDRQFYSGLQSQEDLARARLGFDYWDRGLNYGTQRRG